jgi:hypothetical protein
MNSKIDPEPSTAPAAAPESTNKEQSIESSTETDFDVRQSNVCYGYSVVIFGVLVLSIDALLIREVVALGLFDWVLVFYRYTLVFFNLMLNIAAVP